MLKKLYIVKKQIFNRKALSALPPEYPILLNWQKTLLNQENLSISQDFSVQITRVPCSIADRGFVVVVKTTRFFLECIC